MTATRIRHRVNAPRPKVYRALLDPRAVSTWMVPTGMTSHVHTFDPREGGAFRISPAGNEAGWRSSLAKLAALVEAAS